MIVFPSDTRLSVTSALTLCGKLIIPSVFAYMFASDMLISCGMDRLFAKIIGKPFCALFHLPSDFCCAYIISLLCGYAQGANAVNRIYNQEKFTESEAQKALLLCSNPSPSFLIIGVGGILGNYFLGFTVYLISITSIALFCLVSRPKKSPVHYEIQTSNQPTDIITDAVKRSTLSTIYICGYVIVFAVICDFLIKVFEYFKFPYILKVSLISLFEITNFTSVINSRIPLFIICFGAVWSGFCVHIQIKSLAPKIYNFKSFTLYKLLQSIIALLLGLFL